MAGIQPKTLMWRPGTGPRRRGKPLTTGPSRRARSDLGQAGGACLPKRARPTLRWREGSADWLSSRFARVRVGVGHSRLIPDSLSQEWLLIEWPEGEAARLSIGYRRYRRISASANSSTLASCAGVSSATIRSSSRKSGLGTSKGADGAASIITPRCASQPTDSWSPRGRRFPPQDLVPPRSSQRLSYPTVTDPGDPPLRPERHIPNSIATTRVRLINSIIKNLPRCPCCGANAVGQRRRIMTQ